MTPKEYVMKYIDLPVSVYSQYKTWVCLVGHKADILADLKTQILTH